MSKIVDKLIILAILTIAVIVSVLMLYIVATVAVEIAILIAAVFLLALVADMRRYSLNRKKSKKE